MDATTSFGIGTAVILLGWIVVNRLTNQRERARDRETRIRHFIVFMDTWKTEVADCGSPTKQGRKWEEKKLSFAQAASTVKRDFRSLEKLSALQDATWIAGHHAGHVDYKEGGIAE